MVRLRHYDNLGTARFVTFSCYRRYKLFRRKQMFDSFLAHLESFRCKNGVSILGFVVMPNHVHLVIYPLKELKIVPAIGRLKSGFAFEILSEWRQNESRLLKKLRVFRGGKESLAFWQLRCYDHNCRTPETVREKINYCHMNPVKWGLVESPEDWQWSSYNWYHGKRDTIVKIDEVDDIM